MFSKLKIESMENKIPFLAALCTAVFGLLAIIKPLLISKIANLTPQGKAGISELRAVYGGWILGLAGYAVWSQSINAYYCLGIGWLGAGIIRIVSFIIDKSYSPKNLRMVIYEILFASLLLIKF